MVRNGSGFSRKCEVAFPLDPGHLLFGGAKGLEAVAHCLNVSQGFMLTKATATFHIGSKIREIKQKNLQGESQGRPAPQSMKEREFGLQEGLHTQLLEGAANMWNLRHLSRFSKHQ